MTKFYLCLQYRDESVRSRREDLATNFSTTLSLANICRSFWFLVQSWNLVDSSLVFVLFSLTNVFEFEKLSIIKYFLPTVFVYRLSQNFTYLNKNAGFPHYNELSKKY